MRLALAFLAAGLIAIVGATIFEALDIGGLAWYGLILLGVIVATLIDYENFYGPRKPKARH